VTSARIVSEVFFFDFSQATCGGVSQTATRSIPFSPASFFTASVPLDHPYTAPVR